jgi:hypothetical protein
VTMAVVRVEVLGRAGRKVVRVTAVQARPVAPLPGKRSEPSLTASLQTSPIALSSPCSAAAAWHAGGLRCVISLRLVGVRVGL